MAKLNHLTVTALKDTRVVTAVKKIRFVDGVNGIKDRPEGQADFDMQEHAVTLAEDQQVEIDVRDEQLEYFRAAVSRGDIEVVGLPPAVQKAASK